MNSSTTMQDCYQKFDLGTSGTGDSSLVAIFLIPGSSKDHLIIIMTLPKYHAKYPVQYKI